jgi:hypothetical protein
MARRFPEVVGRHCMQYVLDTLKTHHGTIAHSWFDAYGTASLDVIGASASLLEKCIGILEEHGVVSVKPGSLALGTGGDYQITLLDSNYCPSMRGYLRRGALPIEALPSPHFLRGAAR